MFKRPVEYFVNRFHDKQETAWLAYKGGLDIVLDWGRRSGKSQLIAEVFVEDVETYGKDCLYIALTQGQAREIMWSKFVDCLSGRPEWKPNEARLEWKHLKTGGIISLKGADLGKDRLRGSAKRLIALDEFAFFRDPTIVKDVLVPQLADYAGQLVYCSTPKGKNHFYQLKQKALGDQSKYFTSNCTVYENEFILPEGRDKLLAEYTGADDLLYRQEILAEYVDFQGLVFALPVESYTERRWDHADLTHAMHWRGMDHGYKDETAVVWIAYNRRKGYFQLYSEYKQKQLLIHKHAEIINAHEEFPMIDTISDIDPQVIEEYRAVGLFPMSPAGKYDKESRLLRIVNALKQGKLKIANTCKELLNEMATYEWDQDGNDHLIDAMNYGFTNLVVPPEPEKTKPYELRKTRTDSNWEGQNFGDVD